MVIAMSMYMTKWDSHSCPINAHSIMMLEEAYELLIKLVFIVVRQVSKTSKDLFLLTKRLTLGSTKAATHVLRLLSK